MRARAAVCAAGARSSRSTTLPVQVEERQRLELVRDRVREQAAQRRLRDRPAAEAGDHRVAVELDARQRHAHVRPTRSRRRRRRAPSRARRTRLRVPQRRAHLLERERPERLDRRARRCFTPSLAQLVDDVLDRAEHRAERDHDRLRVLAAVAAEQAAGVAAERAARTRRRSRGIRSSACICLACARYLTSVNASGPDHRADRHRLGRVEHLARLERRQERVDLLLRRARRRARRRA